MPYVKVNSKGELFYLKNGEGKNLVFLHGWAASSRIWQKQLGYFSKEYNIVAFDLPGHGNSDCQFNSEEDLVDIIVSVCRVMNLENVNLIATSFGGMLALRIAVSHPEILNSLILITTTPRFIKSVDFAYTLVPKELREMQVGLKLYFPKVLDIFTSRLFAVAERKSRDFNANLNLIIDKKHLPKKEALKKMLSILEKFDIREELSKIKTPTLILAGSEDEICPKGASKYLADKINESKLYTIEGSGHIPFLTRAEEVNKIIAEFLDLNAKG